MAALRVLEELGMRDAFSYVIGSSAGAINGAYFLAGQAEESLSIYYEELAGREFVSLRRFWKIVDIDFLVDDVLKHRHPLDEDAMRAAPAPLLTVLTDAQSAEATTISNRVPGVDIYELFRATAALPGLYNRKVPIGERSFVDGGVADLVPLGEAFARTKQVVVLLTREAGYRKPHHGWAYRRIVRAFSPGQSERVQEKICAADEDYNATMERLETEHRAMPRRTWTLRPSSLERLVNRTTNDRARLRDCAALGRADMLRFLKQERALLAGA